MGSQKTKSTLRWQRIRLREPESASHQHHTCIPRYKGGARVPESHTLHLAFTRADFFASSRSPALSPAQIFRISPHKKGPKSSCSSRRQKMRSQKTKINPAVAADPTARPRIRVTPTSHLYPRYKSGFRVPFLSGGMIEKERRSSVGLASEKCRTRYLGIACPKRPLICPFISEWKRSGGETDV